MLSEYSLRLVRMTLVLLVMSIPSFAMAQHIYVARGEAIRRMDIDGSNEIVLVAGLSDAYGVAVDLAGGKMYWVDRTGYKVQRANLDGSNVEDLVTNVGRPWTIDLDLVNGKMYWAQQKLGDAVYDWIRRANLDGSNLENILAAEHSVYGIAVDASGGKFYYTSTGATAGQPKIKRANLDGSNDEVLVTAGVTTPLRIVVDPSAARFYWAEDDIKRANLDGSGSEVFLASAGAAAVELDLVEGHIYWGGDSVGRADLDGSNIVAISVTNEIRDLALDVDSPAAVPSLSPRFGLPVLVLLIATMSALRVRRSHRTATAGSIPP